jgi:hypothetical protein
MNKLTGCIATAASAAIWTGPLAASANAADVKIGVIYPLTGNAASADDSTGQNTLAATYLIRLQGEEYVSVWPANRTTAPLQWPMKSWH